MFAILIADENIGKIMDRTLASQASLDRITAYLTQPNDWVLVTGYVDPKGVYKDWSVLPMYIIVANFDHDPDKIKTDWDQIVRK